MHGMSAFYTVLFGGLFLAYVIALKAEAPRRDRHSVKSFRQWLVKRPFEILAGFYIFMNLFVLGAVKPEQEPYPGADQIARGAVTVPSSGYSQSQASAPRLTPNQCAAGIALVSVSTNAAAPWLDMPPNAVVCAAWACYGTAEDTFWLPATDWGFVLGTNAVEGALVSSSGTLSFWRPKGSPRAAEMPDGTGISFLAPLQGRFGIVPPSGRFWYAVTDSNSVLFTWQDVFAGRDTNSPVSFQAELF